MSNYPNELAVMYDLPVPVNSAKDRVVVRVTSLGVAYQDRTIFESVSFTAPWKGPTWVVGPVGAGKSTLLRTLSGHVASSPSVSVWGKIEHFGDQPPCLVGQNLRLMMSSAFENLVVDLPNRSELTRIEQREIVDRMLDDLGVQVSEESMESPAVQLTLLEKRIVALGRAMLSEAQFLILDEPTAGLEPEQRRAMVDALAHACDHRSVLMTTHNRHDLEELPGMVCLVAGGRLVEMTPTEEFLFNARTDLGRRFAETGSCDSPTPEHHPPSSAPRPAAGVPRGFHWIMPGRLGGTPRPGLLEDVDIELDGLMGLGVRILVSLEEVETVDREALALRGIKSVHVPIVDMDVPEHDVCDALCRDISDWIDRGLPVVVHCKAGLGRTGTILAAVLIHRGAGPVEALERIREIQPRFVQSEKQLKFLEARR